MILTHIKMISVIKKGCVQWMDGQRDDMRFYVLFNSISVISGQRELDNERLCAMELCLWLRGRIELGPLDQYASA